MLNSQRYGKSSDIIIEEDYHHIIQNKLSKFIGLLSRVEGTDGRCPQIMFSKPSEKELTAVKSRESVIFEKDHENWHIHFCATKGNHDIKEIEDADQIFQLEAIVAKATVSSLASKRHVIPQSERPKKYRYVGDLNGIALTFEEDKLENDGDCGLHGLGLSRGEALTLLSEAKGNIDIRALVAPEIMAAAMEGTLPASLRHNEKMNELKHIFFEKNQGKEDSTAGKQARARLLSYCTHPVVYNSFVQEYLGAGGWLTYSRSTDITQTSSIDALARLREIRVTIWQVSGRGKVTLVHDSQTSDHNGAVYLLHTNRDTHYNLLSIPAHDAVLSPPKEKQVAQYTVEKKVIKIEHADDRRKAQKISTSFGSKTGIDSIKRHKYAAHKNLIAYEINKIELWLLFSLAYRLKKSPKELVSEEALSFFVPIAFFIKKFKEAMNIRRNPGDFAHRVIDDLIKKIQPLLKNVLDKQDYFNTFKIMPLQIESISAFLTSQRIILSKLFRVLSDPASLDSLQTKIMLLPQLLSLRKYLVNNFLGKEKRSKAYNNILKSITYRNKLDLYLLKSAKREYNKSISDKKVAKKAAKDLAITGLNILNEIVFSEEEIKMALGSSQDEINLSYHILVDQALKKQELDQKEVSAISLLQHMNFDFDDSEQENSDEDNPSLEITTFSAAAY